MEIKIRWTNEPEVQEKIKKNMDQLGKVVRDAMREAAMETRDFMMARGAEDIAEAGNFGERWQEAFTVDTEETQRTIRLTARMDAKEPPVIYWPVFEYGKTIEAKNASGYMWLPFIGATGVRDQDGSIWPRDYGTENLYRRTSKAGNEVLFDRETNEPKYLGKESVTIPKKFHLHEIMREEAVKAKAAFKRILSEMLPGK